MNLATLLHRAAALHGERACLTLGTEVIYTYAGAARSVSRIAAGMRDSLHLGPGARIAVFMPADRRT